MAAVASRSVSKGRGHDRVGQAGARILKVPLGRASEEPALACGHDGAGDSVGGPAAVARDVGAVGANGEVGEKMASRSRKLPRFRAEKSLRRFMLGNFSRPNSLYWRLFGVSMAYQKRKRANMRVRRGLTGPGEFAWADFVLP